MGEAGRRVTACAHRGRVGFANGGARFSIDFNSFTFRGRREIFLRFTRRVSRPMV